MDLKFEISDLSGLFFWCRFERKKQMDPIKLRELAASELDEARKIQEKADSESRTLTVEEINQYNAHVAKSDEYLRSAERKEKFAKVEEQLQKPQERKTTPEIGTGERIEVAGGIKLHRHGILRAFKGPNAELQAYRSGRFLAAALFGHARSSQWCCEHGIEIKIETESENRAAGEGINTSGGYIVPDEFENTIIDLRAQYGSARKNLRTVPMGSNHSNQPKKTGGLTAYPVGENQTITESEQSWGNVEITARKWAVLTRISSELDEDSLISLADDLAMDIALAFATAEDTACIDGDGTSTYHKITGIRPLMIDGSHTGSYVDGSSGNDNWSEITAANLLSIMAAVPKYARLGAKWHCSPYAKVAVFDRLLMAAGGNQNRNLAEGQPATYNGYPIEEWQAMPEDDSSAALNNKIMFMFGNLSLSSKLGTRRGITIKRLLELYAASDQIGIQATERFDINHHSITGATSSARGPICGFMGGT
jgi:HK97 family phage major capsid protein